MFTNHLGRTEQPKLPKYHYLSMKSDAACGKTMVVSPAGDRVVSVKAPLTLF